MKVKKIISMGISGVLIFSMLAGCGNHSEETESPKTEAAAGEGEKVELELFSNKQESVQTLQSIADQFNAQSESVTITVKAPADGQTVLKTRMAKGDVPDLIANAGDSLFTELTESGFIENLSGMDFFEKINPEYVEAMYGVTANNEETEYGIPYAAHGVGVIYNKDIFEQAGVEIPETWDEFMDVCETLKSQGITPFELTAKSSWTLACIWNLVSAGNQPDNFVPDRKAGNTTFLGTHERALECMLQISEYAQEDYMGTSYEDGTANFGNGGAAMMLQGNWAIPEILKANSDCNIDMFPFPASDDSEKTRVVTGLDVVLMLSTEAKDKEGAEEFLEFMLQPEIAQQYTDEQSAFSCVKGIEQKLSTVSTLSENIAAGKIVATVDHTYPAGLDVGGILSELFLNKTNGMAQEENIENILIKFDEQFDIVNE